MKYFLCLVLNICFVYLLSTQQVNYENHIRPIIENHCLKCHHPGGIAPMAFRNYADVISYGQMIQYVTETKYMPPWLADTPGQNYKHQNQLTDEQISFIKQWVQDGMPKSQTGAEKNLIFRENHLIDHDVEIEMVESFEQYDIYFDQFQVFVIPYDIGQDTFVEAIEFIPGEKTIVRSCQVSITNDSSVLKKDIWDPRYGYNSFGGVDFHPEWSQWYHWSTGDLPFESKTHNLFLPANGFFLFHIHYGPTSDKKYDKSKLRIKFGTQNKGLIQTLPLINQHNLTIQPFTIPPNEKTNMHAMTLLKEDLLVHGLSPQSNLICQSWEVYAKPPDSQIPIHLLRINQWDFKWKRNYQFTEPVFLPAGTEIHAFANYNNTIENLSLPGDQPIRMQWGHQMFEEMFLVHFMVSSTPVTSQNMIEPRDIQILPGETTLTKQHMDLKLMGDLRKGDYIEFCHWDLKYSKIITLNEYLSKQSPLQLNMKDFPKGNYSLHFKNAKKETLSKKIFTIIKQDTH